MHRTAIRASRFVHSVTHRGQLSAEFRIVFWGRPSELWIAQEPAQMFANSDERQRSRGGAV